MIKKETNSLVASQRAEAAVYLLKQNDLTPPAE